MFHLAAWYESKDPAGALVTIDAVREEMIFTNGDDLRVPTGLTNIIGATALENHANGVRAQVQSPSLRAIANLDVEPIVLAAVYGSPPEGVYHPEAPIPITADEALNFAVQNTPGGAVAHYGGVWLADGPQQPVTGNIFSMRAVGAITQVAGAWVNGNLAFAQTLPAGRYAIVGMRARSADAVFARLVFPEHVARPGVMVVNAIGDQDIYWQRYGRTGVYGEFPHTNPPTLDVLGGAGTAQYLILDCIRVK
jgi:hypothetical protein